MKKLKFLGGWTTVVLLAGVLALAGCDSTQSNVTPTVEPGADIEEFEPIFDDVDSTGFRIRSSTAAVVSRSPVDTGQEAEYAVNRTQTVPSSGWKTGLSWSNLEPDETYYVFARAKEIPGEYAAGAVYRPIPTQKTKQEGEVYSIDNSWDPDFAYSTNGNNFTFKPARPASSYSENHPVEYAHNTSETVPPTSGWQSTALQYRVSVLGEDQRFLWARTQATDNLPAGEPLQRRIELPGPSLTEVSWVADYNPSNLTHNSAVIAVTADFTTEPPDFENLIIEYGLSSSAANPPPNSGYRDRSATGGLVTFSAGSLNADTPYYLWARAKAVPNYLAGEPIKYDSENTTPFFRTRVASSSGSSAETLAKSLNDMYPAATTPVATTSNDYVVLLGANVALKGDIEIPSGVTLVTLDNELDANLKYIRGGGSIAVSPGGTFITGSGQTSIYGITVNVGGAYRIATTSDPVGKEQIGDSDDGALQLERGTITLRPNGVRTAYILNSPPSGYTSEAKIPNGNTFNLPDGDTFLIQRGAKLEIEDDTTPPDAGAITGEGTITVDSGGFLKAAVFDSFDDFKGRLVVKANAELEIDDTIKVGYAVGTNVTDPNFRLLAGSDITFTRPSAAPALPIFTLTGDADIGADTEIDGYNLVIAGKLNVPQTLEVTANTALTVGGQLVLAAGPGVTDGGKLDVASGGTLTVNSGGIVTVNARANLTNGGTAVVNGTIDVNANGLLYTNGSSFRGGTSGKVNVKGKWYTENSTSSLTEFLTTGNIYAGYLDIREGGELYRYTAPSTTALFIGYSTSGANAVTNGFYLNPTDPSTTANYIRISFDSVNRVPVLTLTGKASVKGTAVSIGRFEATGDARLEILTNTTLNLGVGTELRINNASNLMASATGTEGNVSGSGRLNVTNAGATKGSLRITFASTLNKPTGW